MHHFWYPDGNSLVSSCLRFQFWISIGTLVLLKQSIPIIAQCWQINCCYNVPLLVSWWEFTGKFLFKIPILD